MFLPPSLNKKQYDRLLCDGCHLFWIDPDMERVISENNFYITIPVTLFVSKVASQKAYVYNALKQKLSDVDKVRNIQGVS
ncbi:hypothetical protein Bhyg_11729 [Pseudolycoriella hygida]|uniref:Uncharacterized protein n=1 Tax=Pseudolycoriella hygida TaxID=35572 RepID=A0A9Q0MXQ1_9DIPT|nr:hypothetical protein Bhyg_11729 [Pseudolycoriella hygida]